MSVPLSTVSTFPTPSISNPVDIHAERLYSVRRHPSGGLLGSNPWRPEAEEPIVDEPISISQFYQFVLADSVAKRSELRRTKRALGMYTPAVDYWRLFRLQAAAYLAYEPGPGPDALDTAIELAHPDRKVHYHAAVVNYRRLLAGRQVAWLGEPRRAMWLAEGLQVRVNPELHISIDGEPHVVKLYLKSDDKWALTQRTANGLAYLVGSTHGHLGRPLVWDVMRGNCFSYETGRVDPEAVLRAEAAAFVSHWQSDRPRPRSA